jgi:single-strand DNA-binding protein
MRYTPSGVPVTTFSVAVTKTWNDQAGQRQEKTKWFLVSCWRKLAETAAQYVTKGMLVMVRGEVDARAYTGKDGEQKVSLDLSATKLQFLSGGKAADEAVD